MGDALRKALLKSEQKPDEIHEAIREVCALSLIHIYGVFSC